MTVPEIEQAIEIVKYLRGIDINSALARKLEIEICIEIYLLLPYKTDTPGDQLYSGIPKEVLRSVLSGILCGRPGDPRMPYVLSSRMWTSWDQPKAIAQCQG